MKPIARNLGCLVAALLLATAPALAQSIHVTAATTFPTANPGGFEDVGCRVDNLLNDTIKVQIVGTVTYSNGAQQTILRPGQPQTLPPDTSLITFIFFAVPPDAALGTAMFECAVRATGIPGGAETQRALSTFEVVAP